MGFLSTFGLDQAHIPLFRFDRSVSRQSLPPALFPTSEYTASVSTWAKSIQDMAENEDCRLRRIVHCQATRQEFLLIYVRHPCGRDAIVLAERDATTEPTSPGAPRDDNKRHTRGLLEKDMRTLGIVPSQDRIRLSCDGTEASVTRHIPAGWGRVHTVKFPKASEAPSVAHLATLLDVLHQHALPRGVPVEARSAWFVYCLAEVMREIFGGKTKTNKGWVRVPYGGMDAGRRDTVGMLIREFTSAWEAFSRQQTRRDGGKSHLRREARMAPFVEMLRTIW